MFAVLRSLMFEPFGEADGQGDHKGCLPKCTATEKVDFAQQEAGRTKEQLHHKVHLDHVRIEPLKRPRFDQTCRRSSV